ncbi:MAG: hypothetical protein AAFN30_03885 [Actinomycetota bacterium]
MTDSDHAAQWALDDQELEALMSGATPEDLGRVGNPVAEFFVDARTARGVQAPRPDESLRQLFAGEATPIQPEPVNGGGRLIGNPPHPGQPAAGTSSIAPQPAGFEPAAPSLFQTAAAEQTPAAFAPDPHRPAPAMLGGAHDPVFGEPAGLDATRVDARPRGSLLSEHTAVHDAYVAPRRRAYDPSPGEFVAQVLRPTGPKVLMGLALVALAFTAGQLLGVLNLPLLGEAGVENQAIGETQAAAPTGQLDDDAPAADSQAAPEQAAPNGPTSLVTVPLPSTVAPGPATTARPAPTAAENTTTPTIATSTSSTLEETTSSTADTSTSSSVEDPTTTVADTTPSTPVEDPTTTEAPTTTELRTATVVIDQMNPAGSQPAGTWSAAAEAGCQVRIFPQGGPDRQVAAANGAIAFTIGATDAFIVGPGCPTTFAIG